MRRAHVAALALALAALALGDVRAQALDPNSLQSGSFVFQPPPGSLPLYDPASGEVSTSIGPLDLVYTVSSEGGPRVFPSADTISVDGTPLLGSSQVVGVGKISAKRGVLHVLELSLIDNLPQHTTPAAKLVLLHTEAIDVATRQRDVSELLDGRVDGQKVRSQRSFSDEVSPEAFGMKLTLDISPSPKNGRLMVDARLLEQFSRVLNLFGSGRWNPATQTADVTLSGDGAHMRLSGLHVWQNMDDGVHLSAGKVSVRAIGQRFDVELTSAFAAATPARVGAPSVR